MLLDVRLDCSWILLLPLCIKDSHTRWEYYYSLPEISIVLYVQCYVLFGENLRVGEHRRYLMSDWILLLPLCMKDSHTRWLRFLLYYMFNVMGRKYCVIGISHWLLEMWFQYCRCYVTSSLWTMQVLRVIRAIIVAANNACFFFCSDRLAALYACILNCTYHENHWSKQ